MNLAKKGKSVQVAIGSNIAQALGKGAIAKVEVHQSPREILPASAPPPSPNFTGRKRELSRLSRLLLHNSLSSSTIAVLGMGGIGKTALTLKLVDDVSSSFPGGIFWADLGDHKGDPLPIISYWEHLCGEDLSEIGNPKTRAETLRGLLSTRQRVNGGLLVVLDDVRSDWIEGARMLQSCFPSTVSSIVTTRDVQVAQALRAQLFNLNVFSVREAQSFIKKISRSLITGDNSKQIAELCGYMPLAIELAVAIALQEGISWLVEKLRDSDQRLATLSLDDTNNKKDSVKMTFDISYNKLCENHPDAAQVFRWLGVFSTNYLCMARIAGVLAKSNKDEEYNAFARTLIDALGRIPDRNEANKLADDMEKDDSTNETKIVANLLRNAIAWPEEDEFQHIEELLRVLDSWNLFHHHTKYDEKGDHYTVHPLLKDYAITLLDSTGELKTARMAFISHYLKFAWTYNKGYPLRGLLRLEYQNIITAMDYSYQDENWDDYFRFVRSFCENMSFFKQYCYVDEILSHLKRAKNLASKLNKREAYVQFSYTYGNLLLALGDYEASLAEHHEIAPLIKEMGRLDILGASNLSLGILALEQGRVTEAKELLKTSLGISEEIEDKHGTACALSELALVLIEEENYSEARENLEKSIALFKEINDRGGEMTSLSQLAYLYNKEEKYTEAEELYKIVINEYIKGGDLLGFALNSVNLGSLYEKQEKYETAYNLMEKAYQVFKLYNSPHTEAIHKELLELKEKISKETSA